MSVDWSVLCDKCKKYHHLGQDMGGLCTFGYGSSNHEGREEAGEFVSEHLAHNSGFGLSLRVVCTDNIPTDYEGVE